MAKELTNSDFHLLVDAGGFSRGSDDFSQTQNEYLVKALTWLDYSAINLGYKEFQLKPSFIRSLEQKLKPPFISANVIMAGGDKTFTQPYVIKELEIAGTAERKPLFKKVRVAILGLCDNKMAPLFITRAGEPTLEYRDPIQVGKALVPMLRKKADMVILLYYGKHDEMQKVLQALDGIDVAVLGGEYYMLSSSSDKKKFIAVTTPLQGKYVGVLTLQLDKNKHIVGSTNKQIPLSEDIAEEARFAQLVKEFDQVSTSAGQTAH
jgi:5'-nucleotidase / UDP-sugar diphosphatase